MIWAREILRRGFASTAASTDPAYRSDELTLRAAEHGVIRRAAVSAEGMVTFTGTAGRSIPAGTVVATPADDITGQSSIEYITTANATIPAGGTVTAPISAIVAGEAGNVTAGVIEILSTPITGVTAVTNAAAITGGTDTESDVSLLDRYYLRVRNPGTSGNKADYLRWALEIAGVGAAKVFPLWSGPGTVKVVIVNSDRLPAPSSLVNEVQVYIDPAAGHGEGQAPIGATVTVTSAVGKTVNIAATITLAAGYTLQNIQDAFVLRLESWRAGAAFAVTYVSQAVIGAMLLGTEGVLDYTNLKLNGGTGNISLQPEEVPLIGTVNLGV